MFAFSSLTPGSRAGAPPPLMFPYLLCSMSTSELLPMSASEPTDLIVEELCSGWDILSAEMFRKPGHWPSLMSLFFIQAAKLPWSQLIFISSWEVRFHYSWRAGTLWFTFWWLPLCCPAPLGLSMVPGTNTKVYLTVTVNSINLQFPILRRAGRQQASRGEPVWEI